MIQDSKLQHTGNKGWPVTMNYFEFWLRQLQPPAINLKSKQAVERIGPDFGGYWHIKKPF